MGINDCSIKLLFLMELHFILQIEASLLIASEARQKKVIVTRRDKKDLFITVYLIALAFS